MKSTSLKLSHTCNDGEIYQIPSWKKITDFLFFQRRAPDLVYLGSRIPLPLYCFIGVELNIRTEPLHQGQLLDDEVKTLTSSEMNQIGQIHSSHRITQDVATVVSQVMITNKITIGVCCTSELVLPVPILSSFSHLLDDLLILWY